MEGTPRPLKDTYYCATCGRRVELAGLSSHDHEGRFIMHNTGKCLYLPCMIPKCDWEIRVVMSPISEEFPNEFFKIKRRAVRHHLKRRHGELTMEEHEEWMHRMLGDEYSKSPVISLEFLLRWRQ